MSQSIHTDTNALDNNTLYLKYRVAEAVVVVVLGQDV